MSMLIIEDDDIFLELMRKTLGLRNVRVARTMSEALALIDERSPEVIILDLSLPDSPLEKTLERIKELKTRSKDATLIVITGHPDINKLQASAKNDGAFAVLSKDNGFFNSLSDALVSTGKIKVSCAGEETVMQIERVVEKLVQPPAP